MWPYQTNPRLGDWRGEKKLTTFFIAYQKGCMNTNGAKEDVQKRCRRGPKPKPRPMQPKVEGTPRG